MNNISVYIIKKIEINYKIDDQALFKHSNLAFTYTILMLALSNNKMYSLLVI